MTARSLQTPTLKSKFKTTKMFKTSMCFVIVRTLRQHHAPPSQTSPSPTSCQEPRAPSSSRVRTGRLCFAPYPPSKDEGKARSKSNSIAKHIQNNKQMYLRTLTFLVVLICCFKPVVLKSSSCCSRHWVVQKGKGDL